MAMADLEQAVPSKSSSSDTVVTMSSPTKAPPTSLESPTAAANSKEVELATATGADESFEKVGDAYGSIGIVSALVLGCGISTMTAVFADFGDRLSNGNILAMVTLLALVITLSTFGTVVMSLQYFFLKQLLADKRGQDTGLGPAYFRQNTYRIRSIARSATWISMALFGVALALLCFDIMPAPYNTVTFLILTCGSVVTIASWLYMRVVFNRAEAELQGIFGKKHKDLGSVKDLRDFA
eukprot:TRINITY_DN94400_c0_g1_i1.p1 TRINITY_DN94400_c0_g1~~TRINITY_DN94400_c0_g1_i1.p1  ORF type:complete len:239 (+),score=35.38 TRINITY_DN94400_c0_g1_i1:67-783(+)